MTCRPYGSPVTRSDDAKLRRRFRTNPSFAKLEIYEFLEPDCRHERAC
jgi:hypothetical protein